MRLGGALSHAFVLACALAVPFFAACGSSGTDNGGSPSGAGADAGMGVGDDSGTGQKTDAGGGADSGSGGSGDASKDGAATFVDSLDSNRDRLLATYLAYLKTNPTVAQSNGLAGANTSDVCDLWQKLVPSGQAVFLTLTARMQGSVLAADGHSMLWHVVKVYRLVGGENATSSDPGSCGGGEFNRMIMSMDKQLHESMLAANTAQGAKNAMGNYDIADIATHSNNFWRDSHDLGGAHAPFDLSDETDPGAPRGQTQYFKDPTSTLANTALGRQDLTTLVDPYALEMDQDYDCTHNSNPSCSYTLYGPLCAPETSMLATDIWTMNYGDFEPNWHPTGCAASGDN
jgi:hypothetical protein